MRIYRRQNMWYIDYSVNGRRVRKSVGPSKKMAELALKNVEVRIAKSEILGITEPRKMIFENLCDEYLQFSKANKTASSFRRDGTSIKNLLTEFNGKLITVITAHDLEQYKNKRRDEVEPATINRELSCIKHMYTKARQWGYMQGNPLQEVRKFREKPGRTYCLKDDEESRLLQYCPEYTKPIVIFALHTGMRLGEILNLRWQDVNLKDLYISVRNSKNHETRTIPINHKVHDTLTKIGPQLPDQYVFSHPDGRPYKNIYWGFKRAARRAGVPDYNWHTLRHSFASRLAIKGVSLRAIQELLGHKTLAMTMRYSHLTNQVLKEAVNRLDSPDFNAENGTNLAQALSAGK